MSKQHIPALYQEKKLELKEELKATEHVAITMDSWTSNQNKEYLGITAHYFRVPDYKLQSKVLSNDDLNDDPTGENIGNALLAVLTEWEIMDKISAVVTDGAAVNGAAVRHIGLKDKHAYCVGHKLNLVVKDSIADYEPVVGKVRRIANFFHHSP
ncbi:zinc finger BED domain-containing protein 1 [Elysia marginata]|uniref:Zinc finger BED domain-containing protein 1 n=1 Tax=Elysia marginata TaxID=1093978 RepID=A0AAV4F110_9GAST|nr:zinc finger BED domain-containing protein 1 [Elysia marginata]